MHEVKAIQALKLKQKMKAHMVGQLRPESSVSQSVGVCEKGIILQSHDRKASFIYQAKGMMKRSLCRPTLT